jgi:hypothetical protein
MTDNKYKKMALKMEGLISDSGRSGIQPIYEEIINVFKSQRDYFSFFKPTELLKIIIYVYSLKLTKKFDLGEKILISGYFTSIFKLHGDKYRKSCYECSGDGSVDCRECDSTGRQTCSSCEGEGDETCSQCDGSGSVEDDEGKQETCDNCDGEGKESCYECSGDGDISCYECGGSGYESCNSCDGIGEIETDADIYLLLDIFTWNESLKNECELNDNTDNPVMTDDDFDEKMKNSLILHTSEEHDEFIIELDEYSYYCIYYDNDYSNLYIDGYQFKLQLREFPQAPFL